MSFEKYFSNGKEITQADAEKHLAKYQQEIIFKNIAHGWSGEINFDTGIGTMVVKIPK